MFWFKTVILSCLLWQMSWCINKKFPSDFRFGAATSSYQIEGAWNAEGKGKNVWDMTVHNHPEIFSKNATGDIAADSYHKWREDVKIASDLGLQFYRFSISWARLLPNGFPNKINKAGVKYYSDLVDALLAEGIEPIVTLYHWELPAKIQDLGGWTNPLIVDWFGDYARVVYSLFADRIKTWLTLNEVIIMCDYGYNNGNFAPYVKEPVFGLNLCNKHTMLAHAKAYRIFDKEFKPKYNGKISIANNLIWIEPSTSDDKELAELGREHMTGRYTHPIFSKHGGWPPSLEKAVLKYSLAQGFNSSMLPVFTDEEKKFVRGTADFFAMNYYTTYMIRSGKTGEVKESAFLNTIWELDAVLEKPPNAVYGVSRILPLYPEGLRRQMVWVKKQYGDIDILITENGYSSTGLMDDYNRIDYIKTHLEQVLLAIQIENVRVVGYTVWSLIDNFEWLNGYSSRFGIYKVDFEDPNRRRTPRASAFFYACVIKHWSLNETCLNQKYITGSLTSSSNNAQNLRNSFYFIFMILLLKCFIYC